MLRPLLILVVSLILPVQVCGQSPLMDERDDFSVAVRGKFLPFALMEDIYGMTATAGLEFTLFRRHSIGAEATWFRWRFEEDNSRDYALYSEFERRKYLYFDYKYTAISFGTVDFYVNAYCKVGKFDTWYKALNQDSMYSSQLPLLDDRTEGKFNEFGCGLGARFLFGNSRLGIDGSVNARRMSYTKMSYDPALFAADVQTKYWGVYARLNLFVLLY